MAGAIIQWRARQVIDATRQACEQAINATLADCVAQAQQPGYVPVDTGNLKNSITFKPAEQRGSQLIGSFGSYTVEYALWQEIGTRRIPGNYYLRRSLEKHFPRLPSRIKRFL